jgi:uncharacterized cupredoxin-like copper-binding protein
MSDFRFEPDRLEVRAGQPLRMTLRNTGATAHDLGIDGLDQMLSPLVPPGRSVVFEIIPGATGSFEFVCHEPGHAAAGMKGTLLVR